MKAEQLWADLSWAELVFIFFHFLILTYIYFLKFCYSWSFEYLDLSDTLDSFGCFVFFIKTFAMLSTFTLFDCFISIIFSLFNSSFYYFHNFDIFISECLQRIKLLYCFIKKATWKALCPPSPLYILCETPYKKYLI